MLEWTTNGNPINSNSPNTTGELIPYIEFFSPSTIPATGTTEVLITGGNFIPTNNLSIPASTINISGASSVVYSVISPAKISAMITTNNASGNLPVVISNGDRLSNIWGDKSIGILFDPHFQSVALFLKGEGENNSVSFVDNSPRTKTITRAGDAKISTTQKKYGNSSIFFDGSGDYLSGAFSGQDTINIRTEPFTVEAWIYPLANSTFSIFGSGENFYPLQLYGGTWYCGDGQINNIAVSGQAPITNQWNHIALTFNGVTYKLFRNKIKIGESNSLLKNHSIIDFQVGARIGQGIFFNGYIDCLQVVKICRSDNELDTYLNL